MKSQKKHNLISIINKYPEDDWEEMQQSMTQNTHIIGVNTI